MGAGRAPEDSPAAFAPPGPIAYTRPVHDDLRGEIDRLRAENAELRRRVEAQARAEAEARANRKQAASWAGGVLFGLFDRQKVVQSGLDLFEVAAGYTQPREAWPAREAVLERARTFATSLLRFTVRRRMVVFFVSMLAFLVPLVQVWLVFQQNAIIENQDKYFNIQVYDIVAKSLTGRDTTAKQITSALLAREDFGLVNGIIDSVFEAEAGGAFTAGEAGGNRAVFLEETAARGHLVSALAQALDRHGRTTDPDELWERVAPTLTLVARDAGTRLSELARVDTRAAAVDKAVRRECASYFFALSSVLRKTEALAREVGTETAWYEAVAPAVARVSQIQRQGAFEPVMQSSWQELLVDLALQPEFGVRAPEPKDIEPLLKTGLERLVTGAKPFAPRIDPAGLKRVLGL